MARDGAAVLGFDVQQLMSTPILSCRSSDPVDAMLARMTIARVRHLPVIEDNELKGELEEQRKPQPVQNHLRHRLAGMARRAEQIQVNRGCRC
jgi:predicted transcriptional regulator